MDFTLFSGHCLRTFHTVIYIPWIMWQIRTLRHVRESLVVLCPHSYFEPRVSTQNRYDQFYSAWILKSMLITMLKCEWLIFSQLPTSLIFVFSGLTNYDSCKLNIL